MFSWKMILCLKSCIFALPQLHKIKALFALQYTISVKLHPGKSTAFGDRSFATRRPSSAEHAAGQTLAKISSYPFKL